MQWYMELLTKLSPTAVALAAVLETINHDALETVVDHANAKS